MKSESRVQSNLVKSSVNEKNGHINEAIQSEELGCNTKTTTRADKYKQTSRVYYI